MRRLRQWLVRLTTSMTRRHDDTRLREDIDDYVVFLVQADRKSIEPRLVACDQNKIVAATCETLGISGTDAAGGASDEDGGMGHRFRF